MRWRPYFVRTIENDRKKKNLPNLLTLIRVMPLTLLVLVFLIIEKPYLAGFFFILAAITDLVDGYTARKRKQVTETGKILDPIADKIFILVPLAALAALYGLSWTIVIIIASREFAVSLGRDWIDNREKLRGCISVGLLGKLKMWTQSIGVIYAIFQGPYFNKVMWVAVFFTVVSGLEYGFKVLRRIKEVKKEEAS